MTADVSSLKKELYSLIVEGRALMYALAVDQDEAKKSVLEEFCKENKIKIPKFELDYESWYSAAQSVISTALPERLEDFRIQYRNDKRKQIDAATYTISDALVGITSSRGIQTLAGPALALPKINIQIGILKSVTTKFEKRIADLESVLQADLFDNELDAASSLAKSGHLRPAGAVAGVVLERHLKQVSTRHGFVTRKKNPTISDFNNYLKDNAHIDTPAWRRIQHLGDLRNLCGHPKEREPTPDEINDLISGVQFFTKTLF